jgi:Cu2+-exporting ATPase
VASLEQRLRDDEPGSQRVVSPASCRHCGLPVPARGEAFCCAGCAAVHALLVGTGLARFYELGGGRGQPVGAVPEPRPRHWLAGLEERGRLAGTQVRVELDVQGIHCAACVWLIEELWRRHPGALRLRLNPSLGRADMVYDRERLELARFLDEVERFGYRFAPASKQSADAERGLLVRLGVCVALALNAMLFALAGYLGMGAADSGYLLFRVLSAACAAAAVAVGGPVFFRGALAGLRHRVLHLDLPISLGIVLAFASSLSCAVSGAGESYFDTVTVFIALMVLGRYLQVRAIRKNRDYLLADDGIAHLRARRLRGGRLEMVPVAEIRSGDTLRLAPGDLVPVRAELRSGPHELSLDWINGEPLPRAFAAGAAVPAGAFVAGRRPALAVALEDARDAELLRLLAAPSGADRRDLPASRCAFWTRLNRIWAAAVLVLAALATALWLVLDASRALEVATAVLVVTCPCAAGLATPLAFEIAVARLRRHGVYVRGASLLDKARHVKKVIFDKTGTVTWGGLRAHSLRTPDATARDVLLTMVASSNHPKSRAIARDFPAPARFLPDLPIEEIPGEGLRALHAGHEYRLGSPSFVFGPSHGREDPCLCLFTRDGHVEACFELEEDVRDGSREEIADLARRGYAVHLLSGDGAAAVARVAERLGIARERAHGELSPAAKAELVGAIDRADTLMVGDGLNDAPAFAAAYCAGTPALETPVMPAHADFFFRCGAGAVLAVLDTARALHRVVVANLVLGGAYNAAALALAFAGWMNPLLCAVAMPASSLLLLLHTGLRLHERRRAEALP